MSAIIGRFWDFLEAFFSDYSNFTPQKVVRLDAYFCVYHDVRKLVGLLQQLTRNQTEIGNLQSSRYLTSLVPEIWGHSRKNVINRRFGAFYIIAPWIAPNASRRKLKNTMGGNY